MQDKQQNYTCRSTTICYDLPILTYVYTYTVHIVPTYLFASLLPIYLLTCQITYETTCIRICSTTYPLVYLPTYIAVPTLN